jgi:hypothetical protein
VYLGDVALTVGCSVNPIKDPLWNAFMLRVISEGPTAGFTLEEAKFFEELFGIYVSPSSNLQRVFADFFGKFSAKYKKDGPCSKYFLENSSLVSPPTPLVPTQTTNKIRLSPENSCTKGSRCY